MLHLFLWTLSMTHHIDTSRIKLSSGYNKIKIFNQNGNINIEYIPSAEFSFPFLTIKKSARGNREKFEMWIKKIKIITKERDNFYEIKVEQPNYFKGLDNRKVDLTLALPYTLDYIQAEALNGCIWIKNFVSKKFKINTSNGIINVEEIKGEGEIEVNNGNIYFKISHSDILDIKLRSFNGNVLISCPPFTQVFPSVMNGMIEGDLFFERSDISQKIECKVYNGTLEVRRK